MNTRVFWYQNTACFHLVFPPDQNSRHHLLPGHFMNYQWVWEMHLNTTIRFSSLLTLISGGAFQNRNCKHSSPGTATQLPIRSVCPYGPLELYKALKCEEFKKGFFQRRLDIFCMIISLRQIYTKKNHFLFIIKLAFWKTLFWKMQTVFPFSKICSQLFYSSNHILWRRTWK